MKATVPLLLLPALVAADQALVNDYSSPPHRPSQPVAVVTPTRNHMTHSTTPAPTSPPASPFAYEQLPHALKQFILDMTPKSKIEQRQQAAGGGGGAAGGGVAPGGGVPVASTPTQLSPVTKYNIGDGDVVYTQTFHSPPDQWSSAAPGTIGLGSISGATQNIGKVKTYNNPAPTHAPERVMGVLLAGGVGAAMIL